MNASDIVLQFLERINQHDADRLAELMSEDHVFVDSLGHAVHGREAPSPQMENFPRAMNGRRRPRGSQ